MKFRIIKKSNKEKICLGCKLKIKKGQKLISTTLSWKTFAYRGYFHNKNCFNIFDENKKMQKNLKKK